MDKNDKEKNLLKNFAANSLNSDIYKFPEIDLFADSYYIHRDNNREYIKEYEFDTAVELRAELEYLWKEDDRMSELIQPMIVAALKNKPINETLDMDRDVESKRAQDQGEKLLAYIYNF